MKIVILRHQETKYTVTKAKVEPFIELSINNEDSFSTRLAGDYNIYNLLAAYSLLKELNLDNDLIKKWTGQLYSEKRSNAKYKDI